MKIKYIHWIEIDEKHYLSIGKKAPWNNKFQIRVPLFIAKLLNHII
jgi:hypothetical protein